MLTPICASMGGWQVDFFFYDFKFQILIERGGSFFVLFEFSKDSVRVWFSPPPTPFYRNGHRSRNVPRWPHIAIPALSSEPSLCYPSAESWRHPTLAGPACFTSPEPLDVCGQCCGSSSVRIPRQSTAVYRRKSVSSSRTLLELPFHQRLIRPATSRVHRKSLLLGRRFSHPFRLFRWLLFMPDRIGAIGRCSPRFRFIWSLYWSWTSNR